MSEPCSCGEYEMAGEQSTGTFDNDGRLITHAMIKCTDIGFSCRGERDDLRTRMSEALVALRPAIANMKHCQQYHPQQQHTPVTHSIIQKLVTILEGG